MTPPSTPAPAPTPIATIDSPNATITMRPWRSAKWPGANRQPLVSMNSGPAMSNASAVAHTARRAPPSRNEPEIRIAVAIAVLVARPTTEWRRPESSRLASMNNAMWAARTPPYARTRVTPRSPKAPGTHNDVTSSAAIAANSTRRTPPSSGSTTLVSHAYPTHDHHSSPSTTRPRPMPRQLGSFAISAVHCVMASTNTRSKNNSNGLTVSPGVEDDPHAGRAGRGRAHAQSLTR